MVFKIRYHFCECIACGTNFQMDLMFFQMIHQIWVFHTSYTMTYTGWFELVERFFYTFSPARFSCMSCTVNVMAVGVLKCFNVIINRKTGLIGCDVKSNYTRIAKLFTQFHSIQALLF